MAGLLSVMADDDANDRAPASPAAAGRFYSGRIANLFRGSETGIILSGNGRQIPFSFADVVMAGRLKRFEDLSEGMSVGFDVGWTSAGLRVTVIRAGD